MRNLPIYLIAFGFGVLGAAVTVTVAALLHVGLAVDVMASPWPVAMIALATLVIFAGALMLLRGRW